MSTEYNPENNIRIEEESALNLWDLFQIFKANWYWFVLSVILCVGAGYLYLLQAPRVYTRTASVLVKEEQRKSRAATTYGFTDLDMFGLQRNVDNEVIVFKAYRLMEMVARRLHLDVSYQVKRDLRMVELYTHSPVVLSFPETEESQSFALKVTPLSKEKVRLSDFITADSNGQRVEIEKAQDVALNDTVQTPVGRVVVVPSLYYADNYYNIPIQVTKSRLKSVAKR